MGNKNAASNRYRDLARNSRGFPREYVRLKQSQIPGRTDFVTKVRVAQKAASSGISASCHISPKTLSSAKVSIPMEKHKLATERGLRKITVKARTVLNAAAA